MARPPAARPPAARPPAARPPAARRPAYRPAARTYTRGRAVHKHHSYHYKRWEDARRDYYRWRTINHLIAAGTRIATKPKSSTTVVVTGTTYYYYNGVYYVPSGTVYVVAAPPPGAVVYAVPAHTTIVYVGETPYYYVNGAYYVATTAQAAKPPPPPPAETTVNVNVKVDSSGEKTASTEKPAAEEKSAPKEKPASTDKVAEAGDDGPEMLEGEEGHNFEVVKPPVGATVPYLPDEADEEKVDGKKYLVHEGTYYRPFSSDGDTVYMVVEDPKKKQEKA